MFSDYYTVGDNLQSVDRGIFCFTMTERKDVEHQTYNTMVSFSRLRASHITRLRLIPLLRHYPAILAPKPT